MTKWIAAILSGMLFVILLFIEYSWYEKIEFTSQGTFPSNLYLVFAFLFLFITIPVAYLTVIIIKADEKLSFTKCSKFAKLIMAAGIFSILVFYSSQII